MHTSRSLCILVVLAAIICDLTLALPSDRVKRQDETAAAAVEETKSNDLNPNESQDGSLSEVDRNKRKVPDAAFEAKNAVLGFVFGENNSDVDTMVRMGRDMKGKGKDDDTPEFNREMVSLDIPDQLFSQSFSTLTNASKVASRFIMNTARRYARFILFFKPLFGNALTVEGYNPPPSTTERP